MYKCMLSHVLMYAESCINLKLIKCIFIHVWITSYYTDIQMIR